MPEDNQRLIRIAQVLELLPVGRSTWWAWVKAGRAPAPIKVSARVTCWRKEEVLEMIQRGSSQ